MEAPLSVSTKRNIQPVVEAECAIYESQLNELLAKQALTPDDLASAIRNLVLLVGCEETTRSDGSIRRLSTLGADMTTLEIIDKTKNDRPLESDVRVSFPGSAGPSYQIFLPNGRADTAYFHTPGGHTEGGSLERFDGAKARIHFGMMYQTYNNQKTQAPQT